MGEITSADAFGRLHNPLHCFAVEVGAAAIPGSEAASQDALSGASFESFGAHVSFLESSQEVEVL